MKIIADSSATRTEWVLVDGTTVVEHAFTKGLNPVYYSRRDISHCIRLELPEIFFKKRWEHIYFYGAGCSTVERKKTVELSLVAQFRSPVTVESDLLGAARGLLIHSPGIACILCSGSNSCAYDGTEIVKNVKSLGFILGDEGSAAYLGKQFVSDCLKNIAPQHLRDAFFDSIQMSSESILASIYNDPMPSRMLSEYARFLKGRTDDEYVYSLVYDGIDAFFSRNLMQYDYHGADVCFVGTNACNYSDILKEVADSHGMVIRKITTSSIPGLIAYHSTAE